LLVNSEILDRIEWISSKIPRYSFFELLTLYFSVMISLSSISSKKLTLFSLQLSPGKLALYLFKEDINKLEM